MKGLRKGLKAAAAVIACVMSLPVMAPVADELMVYAEDIAADTASGTYENLSWCIEDEVLTISGEGEMAPDPELNSNSLEAGSYPWAEYDYTSIVIEEGVTSIALNAFYRSSAEKVILPESVSTIGLNAFRSSNVKLLHTSPGLRNIGEYAFYGCPVKYLDIPAMSGSAGMDAFDVNSMDALHLPSGSAFNIGDNMVPVYYGDETDGETTASGTHGSFKWEIRNGVLCITGSGAMEACDYNKYPWYGLDFYRVKFSGENITISDGAFERSDLCLLELDNVASIGNAAFLGCDSLVSITDAEEVAYISDSAFSSAEWMNSTVYHERAADTPYLTMLGKTMVCCDQTAETVVIPEYTEHIMGKALSGCTAVKTLYIPEKAFTCPEHTFSLCANIEHLRYTGNETDITLEELQELASDRQIFDFTDQTGIVTSGRAVYYEDAVLRLLDQIRTSPYVQELADDFCRDIISSTGIHKGMSDEIILRFFYDHIIDNAVYSYAFSESSAYTHTTDDGKTWTASSLFTHREEGLAIAGSGVCSAYSELFVTFGRIAKEDGLSSTLTVTENYGVNHQWNVIGLDTGTENERWYYLDASNGQYLIGYEANILRENPAMFSYDPDIPLNEDGTYTVTLHDGTAVNIQAKNAAREYGRGDTDLDGDIDLEDAALILSIYAMKAVGITPELSADSIAASDINEDGATNLDDAAAVLSYYAQKAAGLEPSWDEIIKA